MVHYSGVFTCGSCGNRVGTEAYPWRCSCGEPFMLEMEKRSPFEGRRPDYKGFWQYANALPILLVPESLKGEGIKTDLKSIRMEGQDVLLKLEFQHPSGSFKDRGAAVMAVHAAECGIGEVAEDTSGNAGVALSYYTGKLAIRCTIFSTTTIGPVKGKKIEQFGACLRKVSADRQEVTDETLRYVRETYYASHTLNPFFLHGVKTIAFELYEQLGNKAPRSVVVPVGNGTLIMGLSIGFKELRALGIIAELPRLIGVQAAARCPVAAAMQKMQTFESGEKNLAEGIDIARPPRMYQIMNAVRETGGTVLAVNNTEIKNEFWIREELKAPVEPTSLAAAAGARKYLREYPDPGLMVIPLTGTNV